MLPRRRGSESHLPAQPLRRSARTLVRPDATHDELAQQVEPPGRHRGDLSSDPTHLRLHLCIAEIAESPDPAPVVELPGPVPPSPGLAASTRRVPRRCGTARHLVPGLLPAPRPRPRRPRPRRRRPPLRLSMVPLPRTVAARPRAARTHPYPAHHGLPCRPPLDRFRISGRATTRPPRARIALVGDATARVRHRGGRKATTR